MRKREGELKPFGMGQDDSDPRFVTALARGLDVLRAFRRGDSGLSNAELSDRTALAKSTVSRLTYTLTRLGYLQYSADTGRYSLSVSALALGFSALGAMAIRDLARPVMSELAEDIGCSVALGAPDRRTMVYIEHCKGSSPLHIGMEVGQHIKMASSAMGRAYLASLEPEAREKLLTEILANDPAANSQRAGVERAVEEYRLNGYVTSVGEWKTEVNSVGVPVLLHGGQTYALNCGGSALVLRTENIAATGEKLVRAARRILEALGNRA